MDRQKQLGVSLRASAMRKNAIVFAEEDTFNGDKIHRIIEAFRKKLPFMPRSMDNIRRN